MPRKRISLSWLATLEEGNQFGAILLTDEGERMSTTLWNGDPRPVCDLDKTRLERLVLLKPTPRSEVQTSIIDGHDVFSLIPVFSFEPNPAVAPLPSVEARVTA